MLPKELAELLLSLDNAQHMNVVFEDPKFGQYAVRGLWVREQANLIVLTGNDKAPKEKDLAKDSGGPSAGPDLNRGGEFDLSGSGKPSDTDLNRGGEFDLSG